VGSHSDLLHIKPETFLNFEMFFLHQYLIQKELMQLKKTQIHSLSLYIIYLVTVANLQKITKKVSMNGDTKKDCLPFPLFRVTVTNLKKIREKAATNVIAIQ